MASVGKNRTLLVLLVVGMLLLAVAPAFAQTPVPIAIDTAGLTNGITTGVNGIFDGMISFLPVAVALMGVLFGFPLAFILLRWLGGMITKMFSGGFSSAG